MPKTLEITLLRCLAKDGLIKAVIPQYRRFETELDGGVPFDAIRAARQEATGAATTGAAMEVDRVLGFMGRLTPFISPRNFEIAAEARDDDIRYALASQPEDAEDGAVPVTAILKDHVSGEYRCLGLYVDPQAPAASIHNYLREKTDGRLQPVTAFSGLIDQPLPEATPNTPSTPSPKPIADPLARILATLLDIALERQGVLPEDPDELPGRGLEWLASALSRRTIVALCTDIPFGEQGLLRSLLSKIKLPLLIAEPLAPDNLTLSVAVPTSPVFIVLPMAAYPQLADPERVAHGLTSAEHAALISCANLASLPEPLRNVVETTIELPRMDKNVFERAFFAIYGVRPQNLGDNGAANAWIGYVQPRDVARVARSQIAPAKALDMLKERIEERLGRITPSHGPSLAELSGLGEAKVRAEMLIADIQAALNGEISWNAVDRGMLLVGPPGCGKTTLARAMAKDCGIHFLECSAARWQMAGYLNEHLAAMSRDFREARRFEPSIMFIDEIDSIGSRDNFTGSNASYHTQVVNALLAELQGFSERGKVFVIAATNNMEDVDPAIRRAGRLDRVIQVALPTIDALEKIFAFYLKKHGIPQGVVNEIQLRPLAEAAFGRTGADVSLAVRGAVRRARLAGRPIEQADLLAELYNRPLDNASLRPLTGEGLRRVAIHEAGHAFVRIKLGGGAEDISYISVVPLPDGTLGFVATRPNPDVGTTDRSDYLAYLAMLLGGRAAEEVFYGVERVGAGAGGSERSDLAKAAEIATDMVCKLGLGRMMRLNWRQTPNDDDLAEVEELIADAYERAKKLIAEGRDTVELLAGALVQKQEMSGAEVTALIGDGIGAATDASRGAEVKD